jgi:hypothetical protein
MKVEKGQVGNVIIGIWGSKVCMWVCVNLCEGSVTIKNSQLFRRKGNGKKTKQSREGWFGSMQIRIRERQSLLITNLSPHTDHDYTSQSHFHTLYLFTIFFL